jgi:type III restriction enzyme
MAGRPSALRPVASKVLIPGRVWIRAHAKNHNLGLAVPYRYGSEVRRYLPDFIFLVDDGQGPGDLLRLIVEIKGYRRQDAREKASTMKTYWVS